LTVAEIDDRLVEGQRAIVRALAFMGARLTFTCTPYYIPDVSGLSRGASVAWGESSAVVYANSVLGLRTNREGGPLALMAAIAGRTYYYYMHVDSERVPRSSYRLEAPEGYVIDDEIVATQTARKLLDLAVEYGKPVTLGIIGHGVTREQATERIEEYSTRAVESAVKLVRRLRALREIDLSKEGTVTVE